MLRDFCRVEASAVVGNSNNDIPGVVESFENNFSTGILSRGAPDCRAFKAVVYGVTNHVQQRVMDVFEHGRVHFDVFTDDKHASDFSALARHITNTSGKTM